MVKTRTHFLCVVPTLLLLALLFALCLPGAIALYFWAVPNSVPFQIILTLFATLAGLDFLWVYLNWQRFELRVAGRTITVLRGWPWTQMENLELTGAQITLHQSLLDHLLDKGSIELLTAAGNEIRFHNLCHFGHIKGLLAGGA